MVLVGITVLVGTTVSIISGTTVSTTLGIHLGTAIGQTTNQDQSIPVNDKEHLFLQATHQDLRATVAIPGQEHKLHQREVKEGEVHLVQEQLPNRKEEHLEVDWLNPVSIETQPVEQVNLTALPQQVKMV